ncbi:MAG: phosphatase PAP2 family protein [Thiotrichales bacterium]
MNPRLPSRAFDFRLGLGIPIALMVALLVFDPSTLDFAITRLIYVPGEGFPWRYNFWLEPVLHVWAKRVIVLFGLLIVVAFIVSLTNSPLRAWRLQLGYLVLAISLSTSVVPPLKNVSAVHCPWNLIEFGGRETHTPLLAERAPTLNPGHCWPGGHASTGFSLLAFFFVLRDRRSRAARIALGVALGLGVVFSLGRMLQGAHFLSHNLWTLLLDWTICLLCYRWLLYRRAEIPNLALEGTT